MQGNREQYAKWNFQSPPTPKHQKGKPVYSLGKKLPNFGPFAAEKRDQIAVMKASANNNNNLPTNENGSSRSPSTSPTPTRGMDMNGQSSNNKVPRIKVSDTVFSMKNC